MTNFTKNTMIAAAALFVAAGLAGAQTMKAEVPFGFRVAGTVLPAGSYRVSTNPLSAGSPTFTLWNEDTHRSVIAVPYTHSAQKSSDTPVALTFECSGTDCTLLRVAPGSGETYRFWKPKTENNGNTRLAVIHAVLVNAR